MGGRVTGRELAIGLPLSVLAGLVVGAIGTFKHQVGVSAATGEGCPWASSSRWRWCSCS
ncbi:hypothetical protein [Amnibacterium kyonggiense]